MASFPTLALLIVIAAVFSYLNHRLVHLPTTIGVMLMALLASLILNALEFAGIHLTDWAVEVLTRLDFTHVLLDIMLAFLLFAGSLHVRFDDLLEQRTVISLLATVGVVASTILVGTILWAVLPIVGLSLNFMYCLLFGALISPTDPIAVLGILKSAGAPRSLETTIAGESLFNDGIGVVVFTVLLGVALGHGGQDAEHSLGVLGLVRFFGQEVLGACVLGMVAGYTTYRMLKSVNNYQVEVLLTLALAMGLYALAQALHSSGPLAVVVAGLFIGNTGRTFAMSEQTREHVDTFWELVDEILNVLLFVLIGLEVLVMEFRWEIFGAGVAAVPLVLLARWVSVGSVVTALKLHQTFTPYAIPIMTWGGLRGGISVALALSLPSAWGPARDLILAMAYTVVVFSIVVQGSTIRRLVQWIPATPDRAGLDHQ